MVFSAGPDVEWTDVSKFKDIYRRKKQGTFPESIVIELVREWELKYGENPHQSGAIYYPETIDGVNAFKLSQLTDLVSIRDDGKGKGGLSATNTMDISRAMQILTFFDDPACAIMKHTMVSGFAKASSKREYETSELFRIARDCDRRSNFGGTAAFNVPVDMSTAEAMLEAKPFFVDVLAAPGYDEGVVGFLQGKRKELRIGQFSNLESLPKYEGDNTHGLVSIKEMPGGRFVVQDYYLTRIKSAEDLVLRPGVFNEKTKSEAIIGYLPSGAETDDMLTAWYLNIHGARSNGVVFVKNGVLVSAGAGQVERVGAVEQAIIKGVQKEMDRKGIEYDSLLGISGNPEYSFPDINPFAGASCSSDGFFPFGDSISTMARVGVVAALQPYGSTRDEEVIKMANVHRMAMPATGERGFGHF